MIPRVFRVEYGRWCWWVVTDGRGVVTGVAGEPRSSVVERWTSIYGRHQCGYLDVQESIMADQIGDLIDQIRTASRLVTAEGGAQ